MLEANDRFRSIAGEPELERRLMVLDENTVITATASQRIAHIVRSLKNFARLDEADFQRTNIEEGIDTTLTPVHHEFKNRIEIKNSNSFSVSVVLPASGWEMMAKVRRRRVSAV